MPVWCRKTNANALAVMVLIILAGCVGAPKNEVVPTRDGVVEGPGSAASPSSGTAAPNGNSAGGSLEDAGHAVTMQDCNVMPLTFEADRRLVEDSIGNTEYSPMGLTPVSASVLVWVGSCASFVADNETVILGAAFWMVSANVVVKESMAGSELARHGYVLESFFSDSNLTSIFSNAGLPAQTGQIQYSNQLLVSATMDSASSHYSTAGLESQDERFARQLEVTLHHGGQEGGVQANVDWTGDQPRNPAAHVLSAEGGKLGGLVLPSGGIAAVVTPWNEAQIVITFRTATTSAG
jgi:hypothetical protein